MKFQHYAGKPDSRPHGTVPGDFTPTQFDGLKWVNLRNPVEVNWHFKVLPGIEKATYFLAGLCCGMVAWLLEVILR